RSPRRESWSWSRSSPTRDASGGSSGGGLDFFQSPVHSGCVTAHPKPAAFLMLALVPVCALGAAAAPEVYRYKPQYRVPASLEAVMRQLAPGQDAFPEEKEAEELARRLRELGA